MEDDLTTIGKSAIIIGRVDNSVNVNNVSFYTGASSLRVNIDSSGDVVIGAPVAGGFRLNVKDTIDSTRMMLFENLSTNAGADVLTMKVGVTAANTLNIFTIFQDGGGFIGQIQGNGTGVNYVTTSDIREKANITPLSDVLGQIEQITPFAYTGKDSESWSVGFSAQEVAGVLPDGPANCGKDGLWGMDYGKMTPFLWQGVKELIARMETMAGDIQRLKSPGKAQQ